MRPLSVTEKNDVDHEEKIIIFLLPATFNYFFILLLFVITKTDWRNSIIAILQCRRC